MREITDSVVMFVDSTGAVGVGVSSEEGVAGVG